MSGACTCAQFSCPDPGNTRTPHTAQHSRGCCRCAAVQVWAQTLACSRSVSCCGTTSTQVAGGPGLIRSVFTTLCTSSRVHAHPEHACQIALHLLPTCRLPRGGLRKHKPCGGRKRLQRDMPANMPSKWPHEVAATALGHGADTSMAYTYKWTCDTTVTCDAAAGGAGGNVSCAAPACSPTVNAYRHAMPCRSCDECSVPNCSGGRAHRYRGAFRFVWK